jgi:hypothetical protein
VIIGGVEYFLYQKNSDIDDASVTTTQSPSINTQELAIPTELPKDSQSPSLKKDD